MTMVVPCRLITRHRSHIGLTDALTFIGTVPPFLTQTALDGRGETVDNEQHGTAAAARGRYRSKTGAAVRIRGPPSVIATVCSKWAASEPSAVEIDHSSSWT